MMGSTSFIALCLLSIIAGSGFSHKKNGISFQGKTQLPFYSSSMTEYKQIFLDVN